MEYYIYADANAGMFSPERAEHEFHTLFATIAMATTADVTLNEFLAGNSTGITNEEGKYKDWIETKNKTAAPLGLGELQPSNDLSNRTKWQFPRTAIVPANGYLLVWADDQNTTWIDYHTNFNLTLAGDTRPLVGFARHPGRQIRYQQQAQDLSSSRCADGVGPFVDGTLPTPRLTNDCASTGYYLTGTPEPLQLMPNPATGSVRIRAQQGMDRLEVCDLQGQVLIRRANIGRDDVVLDLQQFSWGIYLVRVNQRSPCDWSCNKDV